MLDTRALLASIVESSDDAIIGVSPDGTILSWNDGAQAIYGYAAAEARGRPLAFFFLPERSDEIHQILKRVLLGERVKHFRTMHLRKNGQVISVSLSLSPIIDADGKIVGAAAISRDITQHIRDEQTLREAEEKYRLLFSAEKDAILIFDADRRIVVNVNNAASQLYGYTAEEFCRLQLSDLSALPEESERDIERGLQEKTCQIPLAHHKRKDGSTFTAEMSASTFLWKGRRMLVGIVRDITERRRIQKLSHSLALARDIQQHLLPPQPPAIENLDIHVRHLYCETIGGDYYDFLHHDDQADGVLEFMVGDIAGHGVGSALLMAMAKGVLRNETLHHHTAPENIFNSLNNSLVKDTDDEMFMTMFYGRIDIKSCSLTWNSAGHGPVFWYRSNLKRVEELPTTNIPLGIFADAITTPTQSVRLTPGDILLIGTDGLWETRNGQNQMFGIHRLRQILASWADRSSREIVDVIFNKVTGFCASERPEDDLTALVIKILK